MSFRLCFKLSSRYSCQNDINYNINQYRLRNSKGSFLKQITWVKEVRQPTNSSSMKVIMSIRQLSTKLPSCPNPNLSRVAIACLMPKTSLFRIHNEHQHNNHHCARNMKVQSTLPSQRHKGLSDAQLPY